MTARGDGPLVGVQIDAHSLAAEGVCAVLDAVKKTAAANAVFLAGFTMSWETGGGVVPGAPFPDHGPRQYESDWTGGNYAAMTPERYRGTALGPAGRANDLPNFDIFDATLPEARARGMEVYDLIDESAHAPALRAVPGFIDCLEVDIWNKPARRPCFNNPDYRNWHLAVVADHVLSHDLDGLCWRSNRVSPLDRLLIEPTPQGLGLAVCWCRHCREKAADRGLDWRRAQEGYRKLVALNAEVARGAPPSAGAFVAFWRLLTTYPELLGWQGLWRDGQFQMYRDISGAVRAVRPAIKVGFTMPQLLSFSPFHRAGQDLSDLSHICDYVLLSTHTQIGGARLRATTERLCKAIFGDNSPDRLYPVLSDMMGLDEAPLEQVASHGLTAGHVGREVRRALDEGDGRCEIYAGIDIDIPPNGADETYHDSPFIDSFGSDDARARDGDPGPTVQAAIEAGAAGIVFGRKYSEMTLSSLAKAGQSVRALG